MTSRIETKEPAATAGAATPRPDAEEDALRAGYMPNRPDYIVPRLLATLDVARDSRPVGEAVMAAFDAIEAACPVCEGVGWVVEADPKDETGQTPMQVQCWDAEHVVVAEQRALLQAGPAAVRPATEAEPPAKSDADGAWLIFFEDPEHEVEVFTGAGAERGARHRFAEASAAWNATLFRGVSHNWPEAAVRPVEREGLDIETAVALGNSVEMERLRKIETAARALVAVLPDRLSNMQAADLRLAIEEKP